MHRLYALLSAALLSTAAAAEPSAEALKYGAGLRFGEGRPAPESAAPASDFGLKRTPPLSVSPVKQRKASPMPAVFCEGEAGGEEPPAPPPDGGDGEKKEPFHKRHPKLAAAMAVGGALAVILGVTGIGGAVFGPAVGAVLGAGLLTIAVVGVLGTVLVGLILHSLQERRKGEDSDNNPNG